MLFLVFRQNPIETYQMTRLTLRLVVLLAAVLLGTCAAIVDTTNAFACSCAGISTNRALREADAVFRGTVVSKEVVGRGNGARTDIRFAVDRVYKGAVFSEQIVASRHVSLRVRPIAAVFTPGTEPRATARRSAVLTLLPLLD